MLNDSLKKTIYLTLTILVLGNCYFDANPPTAERLAEFEPLVSISGINFPASRKVYLRYWDKTGARSAGLAQNYQTDARGELLFSFPLADSTTSAAFWLLVDTDASNTFNAGDFSCLKTGLTFSTSSPGNFTSLNRTTDCLTMTAVTSTFVNGNGASASLRHRCVTSPAGLTQYSSSVGQNIFNSNKTLSLEDWFPLFVFDADGGGNFSSAVTALALPPASGTNWNTICFASSGAQFTVTNWSH